MASVLDQFEDKSKSKQTEISTVAPNNDPISPEMRGIAKQYFSSQPDRRASFLKRLGYEMNPKDPDEYRAIGSPKDAPWRNMDPLGFTSVGEFLQDVNDISYDTLSGALVTGAAGKAAPLGSALGGAIGLASGIPIVGPAVGAFGGGLAAGVGAGGLTAFAMSELNNRVGDLFLDEDVPVDRALQGAQSLIEGVTGSLGAAMKEGGKSFVRSMLNERKKAVAETLSKGVYAKPVLDEIVKDPSLLNGFKGAAKDIQQELESLHGLAFKELKENADGTIDQRALVLAKAPKDIPPTSLVYKSLKPDWDEAEALVEQLGKDPRANFDKKEFAATLVALKDRLISQAKSTRLDEIDEKPALAKINSLLKEIREMPTVSDGSTQITYKQARDWLSSVQGEVFKKNAMGEYLTPGGKLIGEAIGGGEDQLRKLLDDKAISVGSRLPDVNARINAKIQGYNSIRTINPQRVLNSYVPEAGNNDFQNIVKQLDVFDSAMGTDYGNKFRSGALKNWIEKRVISSPNIENQNLGSLQASEAVKGAWQAAKIPLAAAGAVGLNNQDAGMMLAKTVALPAAVVGGVRGANTAAAKLSPELAISEYIKATGKINAGANIPGLGAAVNASVTPAAVSLEDAVSGKESLEKYLGIKPESQEQLSRQSVLDQFD